MLVWVMGIPGDIFGAASAAVLGFGQLTKDALELILQVCCWANRLLCCRAFERALKPGHTRLVMAGHRVSLVCTRATADLINREGTRVRFPIKGWGASLEIASSGLAGALAACEPEEADPGEHGAGVPFPMSDVETGEGTERQVLIDPEYVRAMVASIVKDQDLSRYIL